MKESSDVIECLDTAAVCRLAGVNHSTLDYWVRTQLVSPSLRGDPGRRRTRLWTVQDVVVVRAISRLRAAGGPLQRVREARDRVLKDWGTVGSDTTLLWTGGDIIRVGIEGDVESLLREPLQQAFRFVLSMPLGAWRDDARSSVSFIRRDRLASGVPAATETAARRAI